MPSQIMQRAGEIVRRDGTRGLILKVLGELGYRRDLVVCRGVDSANPAGAHAIDGTLNAVTPALLRFYATMRPTTTAPVLEQRFLNGDTCFAAKSDGEITGVIWTARQRATHLYLRCQIEFEAGIGYVYDAVVRSDWRGRGLFDSLLWRTVEAARERGDIQNLISTITPENKPSLAGFQRRGFVIRGTLGYIGLGYRYYFRSGEALSLRVRPAGRQANAMLAIR